MLRVYSFIVFSELGGAASPLTEEKRSGARLAARRRALAHTAQTIQPLAATLEPPCALPCRAALPWDPARQGSRGRLNVWEPTPWGEGARVYGCERQHPATEEICKRGATDRAHIWVGQRGDLAQDTQASSAHVAPICGAEGG